MAIKFNVQEIGNPQDAAAPKKFYARPVSSGEITLEDLASDISHASSINEADVMAVLYSLVREIPRNISQGYIVRLGGLGSFRLGTSSVGSETAEEVTAANIQQKRILFHNGARIKKAITDLTFRKSE
ncbi:DNA-binding protein [Sphingobacterium sp. DN00404]|uniref:DNA-binding protein n=1 Tax=Sphingobacterium micropteri TaxID=2763501 RepID=A0ABR7YRI2_9SPHI|nr:HU family DNA-binding protein [Sphingobacterium micropteri]MBD1433821.1 DNA-binding protein [Sphingobacterium micropteri]